MVQGGNNTSLLDISLLPFVLVIVLHHYKKYLAIAGIGAAITAIALSFFAKAEKEEKHGWRW